MNFEPYSYEGSPIPFITSDATRLRKTNDDIAVSYWLRSPNVMSNTYLYGVNSDGSLSGYKYANGESYVAIILSI